MGAMVEVKQGVRLVFRNGDETLVGSVNGTPYAVAYENDNGTWEVSARVPVFADDRGPLDVAGANIERIV